jgi:hypothetical protein
MPVNKHRTEGSVDGKATRQIVIEIERVRLVRKSATTVLRWCDRCGNESDFVGLNEAARLFEIDASRLLEFVQTNDCHYTESKFVGTQICLTSLLERMRTANRKRLKDTKLIAGE